MLDLFNQDFSQVPIYLIPIAAFLTGLTGSLHCVGMCGPLVTAISKQKKDIYIYQLGRLLGYLFLGALAGQLGLTLHTKILGPFASILSASILGMTLIYWGSKGLRKRPKIKTIKTGLFQKYIVQKLMIKILKLSTSTQRSFFLGNMSLFLPCGLLYSVIMVAVGLNGPLLGLLSLFFFWLGTLPGMGLGVSFVQFLIGPLIRNYPKLSSILLVGAGVLTISLRLQDLLKIGNQLCH